MNLFIDIETIPGQNALAHRMAHDSIKPPATLKKAESIAAWWADESDTAAEAAHRKQSLDGGNWGEIVSIAVTDGDAREWVKCRTQTEDEADLLRAFIATVDRWTAEDARLLVPGKSDAWPIDDHYLIAHNASFDVPYLWRRCVVNGVRVPRWLPPPTARVGKDYACTMLMWAGHGGRISFDSLCKVLGVPSPKDNGMDGSRVYDAWLAGQYHDIAEYNARDAAAVSIVWGELHGGSAS